MLTPGLTIRRTRSPVSMFSPSSGSLNSVDINSSSSADRRVQFFGIDAEIVNRLLEHVRLNLFFTGECRQSSQHNVLGIDFKEVSQCGAILAATKPVRAEREQLSRHPLGDAL